VTLASTDQDALDTLGENALGAAIAWWHSKKPHGWTLEQHLETPHVSLGPPKEVALAKAVSAYLHAQRRKDKGHVASR
jgi:hypothetical protein